MPKFKGELQLIFLEAQFRLKTSECFMEWFLVVWRVFSDFSHTWILEPQFRLVFSMFFWVLLVLNNELTHYFDPAFLLWSSCIVYLYSSYFWGKGFSFWRRNAHVILSLAYFVFIFLIHMQMYCFWGLWSNKSFPWNPFGVTD